MTERDIGLADVQMITYKAYVPFAEMYREVPWPGNAERWENDAEHSFNLAKVAAAVAYELGLDPNKAASYGVFHDLVEVTTEGGDTSVWDEEGRKTKQQREAEGLMTLTDRFSRLPYISLVIRDYMSLESEEARLVYALDKLLPVILIVKDEGGLWKRKPINFERAWQKYQSQRPQVAQHPLVLQWFDEIYEHIRDNRDWYFNE
jgi:putative hydrolase of HD superfamily